MAEPKILDFFRNAKIIKPMGIHICIISGHHDMNQGFMGFLIQPRFRSANGGNVCHKFNPLIHRCPARIHEFIKKYEIAKRIIIRGFQIFGFFIGMYATNRIIIDRIRHAIVILMAQIEFSGPHLVQNIIPFSIEDFFDISKGTHRIIQIFNSLLPDLGRIASDIFRGDSVKFKQNRAENKILRCFGGILTDGNHHVIIMRKELVNVDPEEFPGNV
jgi:hypothetical protein